MVNRELVERLRQVDEVSLLELLRVDSSDLVDAFAERIEENEQAIRHSLED